MPSKAFDSKNNYSAYLLRKEEQDAAAEESKEAKLIGGQAPPPPPNDPEQMPTKGIGGPRHIESIVDNTMRSSSIYDEYREEKSELIQADVYSQSALGTVGPNDGFEFEGQTGDKAASAHASYMTTDSDSTFIQPELSVDPEQDSNDPWHAAHNIANFMFSDEMGLLGIKWTKDDLDWSWDHFKHQISEHPYSTALTLASYMVPIGAAWMKGARVAQRAAQLADKGGDVTAATAKGLFGTKGGDAVLAAGSTTQAMKALGPRVRFDDHAKLVKTLAFSDEVNDGTEFFSPGTVKALREAATDEDISKIVTEKELRNMLIGDMHNERWLTLQGEAMRGKEKMKPMRRAEYHLWKNFGNKYSENLSKMNKQQIEGMDAFMKKAGIGKWLASAPVALTKAGQQLGYKYWQGAPDVKLDDLSKAIGAEGAQWYHGMRGAWTDLFQAQADEGFIGKETVDMFTKEFGGFHVPAVLKGTGGFEDLGVTARGYAGKGLGDVINTKKIDPAAVLNPVTMYKRGRYKTRADTDADLDLLITDPKSLTVGGFIRDSTLFQVHRGFRDLVVAGAKGESGMEQIVASHDEFMKFSDSAKKYWMSLEELDRVSPGLGERMTRMANAQLVKDGQPELQGKLPAISRAVAEQFFGKEGSATEGAKTFSRMFELYTAVHKTARTALNPPTHMSNILGNFMFLGMAGMNPVSAVALDDGKMFANAFAKIANQARKTDGETFESLMTYDNMKSIFGKGNIITDRNGNKIDLAGELSKPVFKELFEAQAFEAQEGLRHTRELLKSMERLEGDNFGAKSVATVARAVAGFGEVGGVKQTLEFMSAAYLGEDVVPKMMYTANLLRKGWGSDAIVREVGRRLPQYKTVGHLQQKARKVYLPWITFPSEAARIIKNNMMDTPVAMMGWMMAPNIAQSIAYGAGLSPDFKEVESMVDGAQPWAHKYQSMYLEEDTAAPALGAIGGAAFGGMAGAAFGGAKGAAVGAVAGAVGGAAVGKMSPQHQELNSPLTDQQKSILGKDTPDLDKLTQHDLGGLARVWSMDFLPTSAVMFSTSHPHEWEKIDPMNPAPVPGLEAARTALSMSPIEPVAIAMPLIDLAAGKGSFGREIESSGGYGFMSKMSLGLYGMLMPPMVQKYGMRLPGPGGAQVPMADIFEANGGQMTLPKTKTATMFGLGMAATTFWGAKTRLGATGAKAFASAAAAGVPAFMAGGEINTNRLMVDLGVKTDPYTNVPGDWTQDFFFNTFLGANKSWKVSANTAADATQRRSKRFEEMRKSNLKTFMDAARNGQESEAIAAVGAAYKSFQYQFGTGDPELADKHFVDWSARNIRNLTKSPQFRSISVEVLESRIISLRKLLQTEKTKINMQQLAALERELSMRRLSNTKGLKLVP